MGQWSFFFSVICQKRNSFAWICSSEHIAELRSVQGPVLNRFLLERNCLKSFNKFRVYSLDSKSQLIVDTAYNSLYRAYRFK